MGERKIDSILYVSCMCSSNVEGKMLDYDRKNVGLQIQKYHRLLAKGFQLNNIEVSALSYNKVASTAGIYKDQKELENGIRYHYIVPPPKKRLFAYFYVFFKSCKLTLNYLKKHPNSVIVCDVLNFTISLGATMIARIMHQQVIGIITDFPEHLSGKKCVYSFLIWKLIRLCTSYILLTDNMKNHLNIKKKSIVILEGHVDSVMSERENLIENKYKNKVCIYAGSLDKKYGIEKLILAFIEADIDGAFLHIYGDGDYSEKLINLEDKRILYKGVVPNKVVVEEELKATLLINPRPTGDEYIKYSFPSKIMEYMVSGTPVLTTRLLGIPKEYNEFVYFFDNEAIEEMANTLKNILQKRPKELHEKGTAAKKFVLKEKNNIIQARKILEMVNNYYEFT